MEGERGGSGRMSSRLRQCEPPAAKGREGKEKGRAVQIVKQYGSVAVQQHGSVAISWVDEV